MIRKKSKEKSRTPAYEKSNNLHCYVQPNVPERHLHCRRPNQHAHACALSLERSRHAADVHAGCANATDQCDGQFSS